METKFVGEWVHWEGQIFVGMSNGVVIWTHSFCGGYLNPQTNPPLAQILTYYAYEKKFHMRSGWGKV